jgi:acetyltransferase-like isoleucine patch superfamily enzyme
MKKSQKSYLLKGKYSILKGEIGEGTIIWNFVNIMKDAKVGKNCIICDNVFIESGALVGNNVVIKNNVLIWKGVKIEDNVFIGPGVVFVNDRYPRSKIIKQLEKGLSPTEPYGVREEEWLENTILREGCSIGANSTILCGIEIGKFSIVGAGSVVTKNVEPYTIVAGNPARVLRRLK